MKNEASSDKARECESIVVTASSRGGLRVLSAILSRLPSDFLAPLILVQHRSPVRRPC